jgi:hypothetical protein
MIVIAKENAPVLINNDDHQNFVETDKIIPKGTTLDGSFMNIQGLRRGKEFNYRIFKDKDGIIVYENKVEPMMNYSKAEGETRVVDMPSVKGNARTHAVVSGVSGVIAFAVAKKMGKTNKNAFMIAGITALIGYGVASMVTSQRNITYKRV